MNAEENIMHCIQCQSSFEVTIQEKEFLKKVDLPEPTLCPNCRRQWRFAWRNERKLYHRKCDLTGKQIISIYAPDSPYKVYEQHEWQTDKWNGLEYGRDFDFNRTFFEQFNELMLDVPNISMFASQNINSDYANGAQQDKNCYMIFVSDHDEDCLYSYAIDSCKDCLECLNCYECTLCVECIDCSGSYNLRYCEKSHNCSESYFLSDCKNCKNCFGCYGLRSKEYCIFNEKHTEQEYKKKLKELHTGNIHTLQQAQAVFEKKKQTQQIHQYYDGNNNDNVTGDHIVNCKDCIECYDSGDLRDCGYLIFSFKSKDCFDGHVVVDNCELCYGTISTISQYNTQFAFVSFYSKNGIYLDQCHYTDNCFACSGLKHNQYCILNKQYTKEKYKRLKADITEHMKKTGEWGMPLPPQLSPFGYNETVAQEYYPMNKKDVGNMQWPANRSPDLPNAGWKWYVDAESQASAYEGPAFEIPDDISEVHDDITEKILRCDKTGKPFKIIPQELTLYRDHNLPLPRACFDERHVERLHRRNPRDLWSRNCAKCKTSVMSSYQDDRPETIYCEKCYLETVY